MQIWRLASIGFYWMNHYLYIKSLIPWQIQWDRKHQTSSNGRLQTQSSDSQSRADHLAPETHQSWHVCPRDPRPAAAGASVWQRKRAQRQLHKQVIWQSSSCDGFQGYVFPPVPAGSSERCIKLSRLNLVSFSSYFLQTSHILCTVYL